MRFQFFLKCGHVRIEELLDILVDLSIFTCCGLGDHIGNQLFYGRLQVVLVPYCHLIGRILDLLWAECALGHRVLLKEIVEDLFGATLRFQSM